MGRLTTPPKRKGPASAREQPNDGAAAQGLEDPPWSSVRRVQLIRREVREYLPPSTVELLLGGGDTVLEGSAELSDGGAPTERCYATAMVTIPLAEMADVFREPADAATAQRVAELLREHPDLPDRLAQRTRQHVARLAAVDDAQSLDISVDVEVRADDTTIYIDADIVASPRRGSRG